MFCTQVKFLVVCIPSAVIIRLHYYVVDVTMGNLEKKVLKTRGEKERDCDTYYIPSPSFEYFSKLKLSTYNCLIHTLSVPYCHSRHTKYNVQILISILYLGKICCACNITCCATSVMLSLHCLWEFRVYDNIRPKATTNPCVLHHFLGNN